LKPQNVLFSRTDNCWKIADFGTASSATSSRQNTTHLSRGTASYRSPEILDSNRPKYNQKTDIFALGCIIYEIVTGDKLFWDDFAIVNYSATGTLNESIWWPEAAEEIWDCVASLEKLIASMLETDLRRRPNASDIQKELESIRAGASTCSGLLRSGRPIQRYLVSGPFVAEDKVLDQSRRNDHKRIPFARRPPVVPSRGAPLPSQFPMPLHPGMRLSTFSRKNRYQTK